VKFLEEFEVSGFPKWYYNELGQVGVDFENRAEVEAYDRNQPSNSAEESRELIKELGIGSNHLVIEFGIATGGFALECAKYCQHVYALDVSKAMLEYAQAKSKKLDIHNISFRHGGFLSYVHKNEKTDFIITKYAFHHLPDFWKQHALLRMAEMLKPGGKLYLEDVIFSFAPEDYEASINVWIHEVAKSEGQGFTREQFEMHVREEYSTYAWILEGILEKADFEILEQNYFSPTYADYLCIKR
jgi:putative AdoMet-dependent methyltransferase